MKLGSSSFSDVLNGYVGRSAYRPGQLARLTGVPQMTIVNRMKGRVQSLVLVPNLNGVWVNVPASWEHDLAQLTAVLQQGLATPEHPNFVEQLNSQVQ